MDNQHRQIKGYRELDELEIALMNEIKAKAEEVGALVEKLRNLTCTERDVHRIGTKVAEQRWVSIGATHLQEGFMALTRSVAKPTTF